MRCYGFIYNPRSGDGKKMAALRDAEEAVRAAGREVREYLCDGDPSGGARAALQDACDVLVACGGDGTVNAIAGVVHGSDRIMAVLPLGTLNHFAKDLGIQTVAEAQAVLTSGTVRAVDAGFVNGRIFVNNSGIGIYPVMVRERERVQRFGIPKWPALALAFVKTATRMPFMRLRIEADGRRMAGSTSFLFVGNNAYAFTGKSLGSRSRVDAGVLGVFTARDVGLWGLARIALRALTGTLCEDRDFVSFTGRKLTVWRKRHFHVSTDGEVTRIRGPLEYTVAPGALRVLAPDVQAGVVAQ